MKRRRSWHRASGAPRDLPAARRRTPVASGVGLCLPSRANCPRRGDRLPERSLELPVAGDRVARAFAPVAERMAGERQVVARLLDEAPTDAHVEELAHRVDAGPPADLELCLGKRGRALVQGIAALTYPRRSFSRYFDVSRSCRSRSAASAGTFLTSTSAISPRSSSDASLHVGFGSRPAAR